MLARSEKYMNDERQVFRDLKTDKTFNLLPFSNFIFGWIDTFIWGGSKGGSVEPPKVNQCKYFDHTFSCEKRTC